MSKSKKVGYGSFGPVCVRRKDGKDVRVDRKTAEKLIAEGGKYIAKWEYTGKIKKDGKEIQPDWSHKQSKK